MFGDEGLFFFFFLFVKFVGEENERGIRDDVGVMDYIFWEGRVWGLRRLVI